MATKKTAAKKTTTTKSDATKTAPKSTASSVVDNVTEVLEEVTNFAEDTFENAVRFARDSAHAYLGAGFVVQERLSQRKFELIDYKTFLEEAKVKGHERVTEVQDFFEPAVQQVTARVEPIVEKIEAQLPAQVREAIVDGRERMRELLEA